MAILVTGAAGFIGFHVARALCEQGHDVIGVDNLDDYYDVGLKRLRLEELKPYASFMFYQEDVNHLDTMRDIVKRHQPISHVLHFAAQAGVRDVDDPFKYITNNVQGQVSILELCKEIENLELFLFASSSSVYGEETTIPFNTTLATDRPKSLYAASKKSGELIAHSYSHNYQIPTIGLRFFTVYGPWGRPDMAPFKFTEAICNDRPITIYGDGGAKRDFTYIDDVVNGILACVEKGSQVLTEQAKPYAIYNLGKGDMHAISQLISIIENEAEKEGKKNYQTSLQQEVLETCCDVTPFENNFNVSAKVDLQEGMKLFVKWHQAIAS